MAKVKARSDSFDSQFADHIASLAKLLELYFRYEVRDIKNVPKKGASLVVMNHGVIPYHGFLFAKAVHDQLGIYPRALGASFLFYIPGVREFFLKAGAVKASPQNAKMLLAEGHTVLLSPGGIYEALLARKGMRRIPWERRTGFVREAMENGVPIVPTYCHGINSAYLNSQFLLKIRIKILELIRFSMPIFMGLGILPLPVKLVHCVGKPISAKPRANESQKACIRRVHREVIQSMTALAKAKVNDAASPKRS